MRIKILILVFFIASFNSALLAKVDMPSEATLVSCQDQAEYFGNGQGDDYISKDCMESFKAMARPQAFQESFSMKMKFYGFRNMILVEKNIGGLVTTAIIAGNSSNLHDVQAMALDEKNQEIAVLESSGNILFFTTKYVGNIAPFRILRHQELKGASELVIASEQNLVVVNNNKTKNLLFFSRLANINGRKGKKNLNVIKSINTSMLDLTNLSIDLKQSKIKGLDKFQNKLVVFDLD